MFLLFRVLYGVWFLGAFALAVAALADTLFGSGPLGERLQNFIPRVAIALLWPLAAMTPRGRYLLWARWRNPQ